MPNQHGYLTLPKEFIPEYLKGFHGYNGLLVGMHKSENGMIEEIVLNGDGELISSHSINTETTESTFVDFWFMY